MADLVITAANVGLQSSGTNIRKGQAGEAITQGQPVYLGTDAKYYLADADDTEAKAAAIAVAITPAETDDHFVMAISGPIDLGATLAIGETYVISGTAGGIAPIGDLASGDYVTHLGIATAADKLTLNIQVSGTQVP